MHLNIEIKAQCPDPDQIRQILLAHQADFRGVDHQIDTYFKVANGRLKLREGNIENHLIHYERSDQAGPKASHVSLFKTEPDSSLKTLLTKALGILVVVDKQRGIYFIDNVKFHIDQVQDLGVFVEIEAIDADGTIGQDRLLEQCHHYINLLGIDETQLLQRSYSDLLIEK
ncbi:MAG: class IV adenylate cyclase [Bacteroidota bacterium]